MTATEDRMREAFDQPDRSIVQLAAAVADQMVAEATADLRAASAVIERIAADQYADPASDDVSVPLAIELVERNECIATLRKQRDELLAALRGMLHIYEHSEPEHVMELAAEQARAAIAAAEASGTGG